MDGILPWLQKEGGFVTNWPEGLLYFVIGLLAAFVMIYLSAGELLPSMGSKAQLDILDAEVTSLKDRLDKVLKLREKGIESGSRFSETRTAALNSLSDDFESMINARVKERSAEKRYALTVGLPLYALLGGAFATAFASTIPIAIFIGFAWTAVADRIGLRRETTVREEARSETAAELGEKATELNNENAELKAKVADLSSKLTKLGETGRTVLDALRKADPDNAAVGGSEIAELLDDEAARQIIRRSGEVEGADTAMTGLESELNDAEIRSLVNTLKRV